MTKQRSIIGLGNIEYHYTRYTYRGRDDLNNITNAIYLKDYTLMYVRLHRKNGPAVIYMNDTRYEYFIHGRLHRSDGPAIEDYPSEFFVWCISGIQYPFEEWCKKMNKSEEEINFLKLKYPFKNNDVYF